MVDGIQAEGSGYPWCILGMASTRSPQDCKIKVLATLSRSQRVIYAENKERLHATVCHVLMLAAIYVAHTRSCPVQALVQCLQASMYTNQHAC